MPPQGIDRRGTGRGDGRVPPFFLPWWGRDIGNAENRMCFSLFLIYIRLSALRNRHRLLQIASSTVGDLTEITRC